jgi:hypothetical protein
VDRRLALLGLALAAFAACSRADRRFDGDPLDASLERPDACSGLACKRVDCAGAPTRITGRVTDPAGLRPLYDVGVYVVDTPPPKMAHGARCGTCQKRAAAGAVVSALTDANGEFVLENAPADHAVPVVVEIGNFRRVVIADVAPCAETRLPDDAVRLPRNGDEGELPYVAVTTGAADALECLLRSAGIDDREFVPGGDPSGHVHLFRGKGGGGLGTGIPDAMDLWNDPARLAPYDLTLLSCEGDEANELKGGTLPGAREAMRDYANAGGHVFATHLHSTWLRNSPADDFRTIASWDAGKDDADVYDVDTSFPKGSAFADWLVDVDASTTRGSVRLDDVTYSAGSVEHPPAQPWIARGPSAVRYFTFNTPIGAPREEQCGRFVFADLHAFGLGGSDFPDGCPKDRAALSAQQLALEFLLFDLFACVDDDAVPPAPPR